ncbi:MAG: hypothetical protein RQ741_11745 [Wenzhouxiangellaceae bacterium]|nr:hypothetical protein [Wenzhouxiangellaceae bacterium]
MKTLKTLSFSFGLMLAAGSCFAAPVGSLEADGPFEIRAAGDDRFVRMSQPTYTWFSGDSIRTRSGVAVLNLRDGGGIGFQEDSSATISLDDDGLVSGEVISGKILYALPDAGQQLRLQVGNFTLTTASPEAQRLNVNSGGEFVGTVERLGDGNMRVEVQSGALHVVNGHSARYQVSAGETIGLLDLPASTIKTQSGPRTAANGLIRIESPERVGTGDEFRIRWTSEQAAEGDYVVVSKSGAAPDEFESVINTDEGQVLEFTAPGQPGDYEIRYLDGQTGQIEQFVYLDVVERRIAGYWWNDRIIGGAITVAAGAVAVYIGVDAADDDNDRQPVSP